MNPEVLSHRGYSGSGPEAAQPNEPAVSERDGVQRVETLRLTTVGENLHAPLFEGVRDADLQPLFGNL